MSLAPMPPSDFFALLVYLGLLLTICIYVPVKLVAKCGDEVLYTHKEFRVNPGEMCHINVKTAQLTGDAVTVDVKEG